MVTTPFNAPPSFRANHLARGLVVCVALGLPVPSLGAAPGTAPVADRTVDIAAGSLTQVLSRFAADHGVALLYDTRLTEGLRLRVKDIDFDRRAIVVREGKGGKDRLVPVLPAARAARRRRFRTRSP